MTNKQEEYYMELSSYGWLLHFFYYLIFDFSLSPQFATED